MDSSEQSLGGGTATTNRSVSAGSATSGGGSSARFESFTEAVPLSLSSVAHGSIPLEDGVLDGIRQVLQHALLSCVNYARIVHPPHEWTFRDLTTSPFAWEPIKGNNHSEDVQRAPPDAPFALQKLAFKHQYARNALIYLKPALPADLTASTELDKMDDWSQHVGILGRVSLLYLSTEPLTKGEMDGTDVDDMPPCMLYKAVVEYRTLPPTGNQQAVQAEELSMLSFGGSIDDCIKFGALASLYDVDAKYVLEIYSTRGKKYKFDLMDSTLSNGMIPRLPSSRDGDPFVKCLCVTVTDYDASEHAAPAAPSASSAAAAKAEAAAEDKKYAVARMQLLLEGKPRRGSDFSQLPPFNYFTSSIREAYLSLNPESSQHDVITALPSGHSLLLDPAHAGRIYVNGTYVTTWGRDPRLSSEEPALFGMDLHSVPMWHNRIVDFAAVHVAYGQLWQEVLIDARLQHLNLATKLLYRLMKGRDPDEDEDDLYDDDDGGAADDGNASGPDVNQDCLESHVMASTQYDPVGIAAKALATRFAVAFGTDAFPCRVGEVEWVKSLLPDRRPIVVPQRVIRVLRRGGYFDAQRTSDDLWFLVNRQPRDGEERQLVLTALQLLEESGCDDVSFEQIAFVSAPPAADVIRQKVVCRYSEAFQQFCIHEKFLEVSVDQLWRETGCHRPVEIENVKAYMLGMYIAKEHPDGRVLARYLLRTMGVGTSEITM